MGNTYFKHKNLHKYTRVARGEDGVEVKSMIYLLLVKKDMLCFVQDVRAGSGMGQSSSDPHAILCKVRLVGWRGPWIKRREVVVRAKRTRSEKLREHQYREEFARSLEGKRVEWEGENNIEHMW